MALKLIVLAAVVAVAVGSPAVVIRPGIYRSVATPFFSDRIVGGEDAKPGEFPWQVSLQWGWLSSTSHFCGASIVNEKWLVTAGHCALAVPNYGKLVAKVGKFNLKETESTEQSISIEKTIVHEQYSGGVAPYDIALMKLSRPLKLDKAVGLISLPKQGSNPAGTAILSGWGSISKTSNPVMPNKLQTAKLPIVDLKTCKAAIEKLTGPSPLHETNVCSGPLTGGYSACNGDSGGPLILKNNGKAELIGIVSWGIVPCGTVGAPSVYTKTSSFVTWIQNTMAKN